jgi:serine/threonine-protein kinase
MAATRLSHQHIVTTLDYGNLPDGSPYLIMEKLSGSSLKSLLEPDVPMDTRRAVRFARQLAGALDAAHEAGVVHRDLKPENVQVVQTRSDGDVIKVLDFGIAKVSGATQLTATGSIVGTPRYMSPEQCRGEAIDARADIYSLGVILYEMVTGRLPFDGDLGAIIRQQLTAAPTPPGRFVSIPESLEQAILRCMEKAPDARFEDAAAFDAALAITEDELSSFVPAPIEDRGTLQLNGAPTPPGPSHGLPAAGLPPWVVYASAGVVAAIVGGTVGFFLLSGDGDSTRPTANDPPTPADETQESTEATEAAGASLADEGSAVEAPLPQILVTTEPEGAAVSSDGVLIGNTPVSFARPRAAIPITVRLRGHEPMTFEVGPSSEPEITLTLERHIAVVSTMRTRGSMRRPEAEAPVVPTIPTMEAPAPAMMRDNDEGLGLLVPSSWDD